ncbi:MAG: XdhC/CoxI family protein [Aeromicrobium sp.]
MRSILGELHEQWGSGEVLAVATVVQTVRSAPRPAGAAMMVTREGVVSGSVSGGCVEGAVYETAQQVLSDGRPVLQRYGFSDDEAFAVGLTCGGIIDVFVEPWSQDTFPALAGVVDDIEAGRPVALATVIEHPNEAWVGRRLVVRPDSADGSLGSERVDDAVVADVRGQLAAGTTTIVTYGPGGERMETGMRVFVTVFQPRARLIIVGAIDFAAAMARQGSLLGFHVTVCDARPVFATRARFPQADDVVVSWPHHYLAAEIARGGIDRRTMVCVLTHDPKFDVPVLELALRLDGDQRPAYVGAMGSRQTHDDRTARLREAGLDDAHLVRLSSPIGLDLGGRTPEETAVSIAAEMIAARWGGTGARLRDVPVTVHHDPGEPAAKP